MPSLFNPPPSRPLQVNTADHRVYSYIVSRPQPRVSLQYFNFVIVLKALIMIDRLLRIMSYLVNINVVNGVKL